jgi:BirA family biotin operon repressor/biotin-[acetyl-CoA-carboxylase] ligase
LNSRVAELPDRDRIAAKLVGGLIKTFVDYEAGGFTQFKSRWSEHDWLFGRELTIDTPQRQITGTGAGVADDGALLVDTKYEGTQRVTSGSVVMANIGGNDP